MMRTASVISRQQRDVNRPPDPVLKLTAVAFPAMSTVFWPVFKADRARSAIHNKWPSAARMRWSR